MDLSKGRLKKRARWIATRCAIGASLIYLSAMMLTCHAQERILYPGAFSSQEPGPRPDMSAYGGEWLEREIHDEERAQEGVVEALFFAAPHVKEDEQAPLVVYLHGNGGRIEWTGAQLTLWRQLGYHVLVPEYRGYGRSVGLPGASAIVEDVEWFIEELVNKRGDIDEARLILHGYSLGGAVAGEIAARRKPWLMVLRSTFSSMKSMANRQLLPGFLARDAYDTARVIEQGDFAVLVTHGKRDKVIPVGESEKLEEAGGGRVTRQVFECGHGVCPEEEVYRERVRAWLEEQGVMTKVD